LSFSSDLLIQADHLASKETRRPKQASLRRATSNAYYALFHFLTSEASRLIAPNVDDQARNLILRWFDHAAMYSACQFFAAPALDGQLGRLAGPSVSPEIQKVARFFRQLQQERHSADYDLSSTWTRLRSKDAIQNARDAILAWSQIRGASQANVFALALLDLERTQKSRN
jgi:uncharacterized protein (UPF0332 family)